MKNILIVFILALLFAVSTNAQQVSKWGAWITVYTDDASSLPQEVQVSFMQNPKCSGYSYYRTKSNFRVPNGYISFTYDYLDCDGKLQSDGITVLLDTPKVDYSPTGTWYIGSKIVTPWRNRVEFIPPPPNANIGISNDEATGNQTTANNSTTHVNNRSGANNSNVNSNGLNAQQQQTQQYINNAQNKNNDAIQQATALNLARIQSRVNGGSTAQQQQQMQQVRQQQNTANAQNTTHLAGALGNLVSAISGNKQQNNTPPPAEDNNTVNTYNPTPTYSPPPDNNFVHNDPPAANALINTKAPDIDFTSSSGSVFKLSNYAGKKVLLVFWASYNDNSISQFNLIKSYYSLLMAKHITVIGIAEEFSRYQWETAVKDNALPGLQLSELNGTGNDTYENYKITDLPTMFFINASGNIMAVSNTFSGIKPQIK